MTRWERLKVNIRLSYRMAVNWVLAAAGLGFAWYLQLPPEEQTALLAWLPVEPRRLPFIVFAVAYIARIWPQPKLSADAKP